MPRFPGCSFLSPPVLPQCTPTEKQTLGHTSAILQNADNTAALFNQAEYNSEFMNSPIRIWGCRGVTGQVGKASQEPRVGSEKNVKKQGISGPSVTAAGSFALAEKFRMTFEGQGARPSKHSLGGGREQHGQLGVQVSKVSDCLSATWPSTIHLACGWGLRVGPGREPCRSREPHTARMRQPSSSHQEKPKGNPSNVLYCLISRKMTKLPETDRLSTKTWGKQPRH